MNFPLQEPNVNKLNNVRSLINLIYRQKTLNLNSANFLTFYLCCRKLYSVEYTNRTPFCSGLVKVVFLSVQALAL